MWAVVIVGWILASIILYTALAVTAKEPTFEQCMDCNQSECKECPYLFTEEFELKKAA